jgi:dolichol-phosphate mannosyltransferase
MNPGHSLSAEVQLEEASGVSQVQPVELAVVIPTLDERANVPLLIARLNAALSGITWEAIFVDDDSSDGTADLVRQIGACQGHIRCLQRLGRRGLSSACIEGILASSAPFIAVMDADLQHDETRLPEMLRMLKARGLDIVIASRHAEGGSLGDWQKGRARISDFATRLGRLVVKAALSDPMSGYFLIRREAFQRAMRQLSGQGFKILLDIFASSPEPLAFGEVPYRFGLRLYGESKLDTLAVWEYLMLLLDKLTGGLIPVRFLLFGMIGGLGVVTHLTTLAIALKAAGVAFPAAQGLATMVAMTGNFLLNNLFTYRDRRLKGWRILSGLLSFYAICGLGALANVGVASVIYGTHQPWWLAGLAGAAIGIVWNYAITSIFTWRSPTPRRKPRAAAQPAKEAVLSVSKETERPVIGAEEG